MPDAQAGHEFTLTAMLPALCGANLIYGVGMLDGGLTFDYAQMVLNNEMITMIRKALEGVKADDESLAVDVIEEVGPRGEYLTSKHTFKHMRNQSRFDIFDRRARTTWVNEGCPRIEDKAYAKAEKIINTHQPEALPQNVQAEVDGLFAEAEAKAKKDGKK